MDLRYSVCGQTWLQLGARRGSVLEKGTLGKNSARRKCIHSSRRVMKICLLVSTSEWVEVGTFANRAYFRGPAFSSESTALNLSP